MRTSLALVLSAALALAHAGDGAAQEDDGPLNQRSKTSDPAATPANPAAPLMAPDLRELAIRAANLSDEGEDYAEARRLLGNLRADARFETQPANFRYAAVVLAGFVEMQDDQEEAARQLFLQAQQMQQTDPDVWYWLSWVEADLGRHDDAARSLARLFAQAPERMDNIVDAHIWRLVHEPDVSVDARTELLQAIFDSGWKREPLGGAGAFHYELALVRAKQGDVEAMRRIVPGITSPAEIVRMLGDRRFDAVVDPKDPAFDPRAAAKRQVKALQAQVRKAPDRLAVVAELQSALRLLGRFRKVIALAEDVQAAIKAAPDDKPPYVDMDKLPWVQNLHATALDGLGRFDVSLARLEAASRLEENGVPNVSQALNLAHLYASQGRPDDALAAAARAGTDMSPYGQMVKVSAEHRAYLLKGDAAAAAKSLDYLRENRAASQAIYLEALVDASQLDAAAAELVALLASPDDRAETLLDLHEYRDMPAKPGNAVSNANWGKLLARSDVQAAVAKVGRRLQVDLYAPD